jgi:hypothetical protein
MEKEGAKIIFERSFERGTITNYFTFVKKLIFRSSIHQYD